MLLAQVAPEMAFSFLSALTSAHQLRIIWFSQLVFVLSLFHAHLFNLSPTEDIIPI